MDHLKLDTSTEELNKHKDEGEEEVMAPVSPTGQYFNSSVMSVCIIAGLESEIAIDDSVAIPLLENVFLPISPRFSSIMVKNGNGGKQWKKVNVKLEDHVKIPVFQSGLSIESYDDILQDYLTQMAIEQLPQNRPLWEIHIFKYPTSNAAGTTIFKLHHALGDGFSLMGALFTCLQRADNPSLPLTFPSMRPELKKGEQNGGNVKSLYGFLSMLFNTVTDFTTSVLKSSVMKDHVSPIRSDNEGKEFQPVVLSHVSFSFEKIKQVKAKLGGTINDMIVGLIFYGTRLYMESVSKGSSNARCTALVLLNTRAIASCNYQTVEEMVKPDTDGPWGNHFGFLHVPLAETIDASTADPLMFISESKKILQKKKTSLAVYLTGRSLELMRKLRGPEITSKYIYDTQSNASLAITSLLGPVEQMSLANHPLKGLYFMVVNVPMSLCVTIVSYMGTLRLSIGADKNLIDHKLFVTSLETAFERIYKAAIDSA